MTAISESVERLRDHLSGGDPYPFDAGVMQAGDNETLASAYLAEHPADEHEPVDEAWLRSLLPTASGDHFYFHRDKLTVYISGWQGIRFMVGCSQYSNSLQLESRGQLRLLCRALQIELTE